jgi:hypothetical protein
MAIAVCFALTPRPRSTGCGHRQVPAVQLGGAGAAVRARTGAGNILDGPHARSSPMPSEMTPSASETAPR